MRPRRKTGPKKQRPPPADWCPYIRDHLWLKAALFLATFMGAVLLLQSPLDMPYTKQEPCQFGKAPRNRRITASSIAVQHQSRLLIVQMRCSAVGIAGF